MRSAPCLRFLKSTLKTIKNAPLGIVFFDYFFHAHVFWKWFITVIPGLCLFLCSDDVIEPFDSSLVATNVSFTGFSETAGSETLGLAAVETICICILILHIVVYLCTMNASLYFMNVCYCSRCISHSLNRLVITNRRNGDYLTGYVQ